MDTTSPISPGTAGGLAAIVLAVLTLPFLSKKVERNLELFLFVMGVAAATAARAWSPALATDALLDPVRLKHPIVEAVFAAGLLFRLFREKIRGGVAGLERAVGRRFFLFLVVAGLGILSSVITAIVAALVLAEIATGLKLDKRTETDLVVVTCFSIGLGAVLTPVGEPLATIAIAKLHGAPFHAGFWFLFRILGAPILTGVLALGLFATTFRGKDAAPEDSLGEDAPETLKDVLVRTGKVYVFVTALVLLGAGFEPLIDAYLIKLPAAALYWINMVSAILDNATLTAAELSPRMALPQIRGVLLGLLVSGGMLIPGNIPNIISAGKLGISSKEWARLGLPLGLALMAAYFAALSVS